MFSTSHSSMNKTKKQVTFTADAKIEEAPSFFKQEKKPSLSAMRKAWVQFVKNNQYEELEQYLDTCKKKGVTLDDFFAKEGSFILSWTMDEDNIKPFEFIYNYVPQDLIQKTLNENNYIIKGLLLTQSGFDKYNKTTAKDIALTKEKFSLLLKIGMQNSIENNINIRENTLAPRIKHDFSEVLKNHNEKMELLSP